MPRSRSFARLGRGYQHRMSMLRTMTTQLFKHEAIETTLPKAMALRRVAEKYVTLGKRGAKDLNAKRQASSWITEYEMVHKLFHILGPRYAYRPGGYTRVVKTRNRRGDNAPMAIIELVDREGELRPARLVDEHYAEAKKRQLEEGAKEYAQLLNKRRHKLK